MTWYGPGDWKKTVLHRSDAGGKAADVRSFDDRITVDEKRGEMTVRSDSEKTNYVAANLAHEVASGFKTPEQARNFYGKELRLADSGKSSSYLDSLRFVRIRTPASSPLSPDRLIWPTPRELPDGKYTPPY